MQSGSQLKRAAEMAAPTVEEYIARLSPDLQGLLEARRIPRQTQADLSRQGIDNVPMLSAIAINRDGLQIVAKDLLGIDVDAGGDQTIRFAQLFLAWQAATKRIKVQDEMQRPLRRRSPSRFRHKNFRLLGLSLKRSFTS